MSHNFYNNFGPVLNSFGAVGFFKCSACAQQTRTSLSGFTKNELPVFLENVPLGTRLQMSVYPSVALQTFCWALAASSVSLSSTQTVELLGRGISPSQAATYTQNNTHTINTDIHALIEIRTHDPSVRGSESVRALDHAAAVIGQLQMYRPIINLYGDGR
jgi:hypothetical protein